jgi:hypothetical protein
MLAPLILATTLDALLLFVVCSKQSTACADLWHVDVGSLEVGGWEEKLRMVPPTA